MTALLELPSIDDAEAFHLKRWEEVCADPALQRLPDRIETNRFGHIIMMPPPGFSHSTRQAEIFARLLELLPQGRALPECAILTSDGVKGVDLAWITEGQNQARPERRSAHHRARNLCGDHLPEEHAAGDGDQARPLL